MEGARLSAGHQDEGSIPFYIDGRPRLRIRWGLQNSKDKPVSAVISKCLDRISHLLIILGIVREVVRVWTDHDKNRDGQSGLEKGQGLNIGRKPT